MQLPDGVEGSGLGKELRMLARPVQQSIPIYLGATAPKGLEQCGTIADGWIGVFMDPSRPEIGIEPVTAAVAAAGRAREDFTVSLLTPTSVAATQEEALENVKPWLTFYLGAMGAKDKNFYVDLAGRYGFGDEAREVQDRYLAGDRQGAAEALPDDLVRSVTVATDAAGLPGAACRTPGGRRGPAHRDPVRRAAVGHRARAGRGERRLNVRQTTSGPRTRNANARAASSSCTSTTGLGTSTYVAARRTSTSATASASAWIRSLAASARIRAAT